MVNKVEICGVNTAKLPVLTSSEMQELFLAIIAGDQTAREKLIKGNLRLVLSVIQRFTSRGEYVDDLFQVGCIGLIKSIDNFDLSQNVKFSTYAVPMIIGEIRRYLRESQIIPPRYQIPINATKRKNENSFRMLSFFSIKRQLFLGEFTLSVIPYSRYPCANA
jgi:DNA-directed RNA polymerase specialized sigma subunit